MDTSGLPLNDVRSLIRESTQELSFNWHSGSSEKDALRLCGPSLDPIMPRQPMIVLFSGTHSIDKHLKAADPSKWVAEQVIDVCSGAAPINGLCGENGFGLKVFDLALQLPVKDIREGAALDEKICAGTIAFGMEAIAGGMDLLCIGSIENAPGISHLILLGALGIKIPANGFSEAVQSLSGQVLEVHKGSRNDPLELLRCLGGRETAAAMGAILSSRTQGIPLILEGSASFAAACALHRLNPVVVSHCVLAGPEYMVSPVREKLKIPGLISGNSSYGESLVLAARSVVSGIG